MAYCPNCGEQVEDVHHYCGSCGQELSALAESESSPSMVMSREGFLSPQSLTYIADLLDGEREVDRDSVSYSQLAQEVNTALADFARLQIADELDLLQLWAADSTAESLSTPVEKMSDCQTRDWLATVGLSRTLRMYDDSLHTEFEDEFDERLQQLVDVARGEIDDNDEWGRRQRSDGTDSLPK